MRCLHIIHVIFFSTLLSLYDYVTTFLIWIMDTLGRHRIIKDKCTNDRYLERYYLFLKNRETFPFNIFLHKFLKSDPDDLHDHPWDFITIILRGGYWEHTPEGKNWYKPFSIIYRKATDLHRIELNPNTDVWTLFIPFRKTRQWGFKTEKGWIDHETYNSEKKI